MTCVIPIPRDSGSHKVQHDLRTISNKEEIISSLKKIEVRGVPRNSHRIWNGRRAPDRLPLSLSRHPS